MRPMTIETTAPALDAARRKALRALAHHLKPVVMIGEAGLTDAVIAETDRALRTHELIKVRVLGDDRDQRMQYLQQLCESLGCSPVQSIGKLLVIWRAAEAPEDELSAFLPGKKKRSAPSIPKKRLEARSENRKTAKASQRLKTPAAFKPPKSKAPAPLTRLTALRAPAEGASNGKTARPVRAAGPQRATTAQRAAPQTSARIGKPARKSASVGEGRSARTESSSRSASSSAPGRTGSAVRSQTRAVSARGPRPAAGRADAPGRSRPRKASKGR
jgi:RNA-binding protein